MRLGYTPQLAATIVMIDVGSLPGVLIKEQMTLGIDMTLTRLDVGNHFPDAVQLITRQVLVDMAGLEDLVIFELRRAQLEVVVGDEHFALANQLPVVAIGGAVVHVQVVGGTHAVGRSTRTIVGHLGSAAHATLACVVQPRHTRRRYLVDGLVNQQNVTRQTRRIGYLLLEVIEHVGRRAGVVILQTGRYGVLLDKTHHVEVAIGLRGSLHYGALKRVAAVAGNVVPDDFQPIGRNREGIGQAIVGQTITALNQLGAGRVDSRSVVYRLREGSRAMAGKYAHLEGVGVALEHGNLARRQVLGILFIVGCGDDKQRLLTGVGIGQEAVGIDRRGIGCQAAGPLGNGAGCVAGNLCANRGQAAAQLGGVLRADRSKRRRRSKRSDQSQRSNSDGFHGFALFCLELFGVTGHQHAHCHNHDRCLSLKEHTRCLPSDFQTRNIARITRNDRHRGNAATGFIRILIRLERPETLLIDYELSKPVRPIGQI